MHVLATAGHVDHGKSTLVRTLTGTDPDRFAEEKARGLTIDLGFAWTVLPSGAPVAFVDVPGHVRFLKNMLAGAGAVEQCLFVVAATEGWKPQSEEHLRILELLGIDRGVVALTKVGLVDDEWRELARMEVADRLAGSPLAGAEIVDVDAPSGRGVDDLRAALDRLVATLPAATDRRRPRLWVDRSFAARGSGTVVTGTLAGGWFAVDDEVAVGSGEARARIRGLHSQNLSLDTVGPGRRVAINLVGVGHRDVLRGDAVVLPQQWAPTRTFDATLRVLGTLDHDVSRRGAYLAYVGSGEHSVHVRVLGGAAIPSGGLGCVRIHLASPVPLLPGDRYVLRESGRSETVGGGEVLDVAPVVRASRARPDRSVDRVVAERGWVEVALLERVTGERREPTAGPWVVHPPLLEERQADLRTSVVEAGTAGLDVAALDDRGLAVLSTLVASGEVDVTGGRARRPGLGAEAAAGAALHPFVAALEATPFAPPSPAEAGVDRGELRDLVRRGLVVERDGAYFAASAVASAAEMVAALLADAPAGVTVAAVRDALGTSRKHVLPLLAHLDATGVTRRREELRIGGPRLPAVDEKGGAVG